MNPGRNYGDKVHNLKLYIINNPLVRNYERIAISCGVDKSAVFRALRDLGIQGRFKPDYCVW